MNPVSFGQASLYPGVRRQHIKQHPQFGQSQSFGRKDLDELCENIAQQSPTSVEEIVSGSLEDAAKSHDQYAVRRIENALIDLVDGLERAGVPVVGILKSIQDGLKKTRAYTPSMIASPGDTHPAFSDWFDSKVGEYAPELEALQDPSDWARGRIQANFDRH